MPAHLGALGQCPDNLVIDKSSLAIARCCRPGRQATGFSWQPDGEASTGGPACPTPVLRHTVTPDPCCTPYHSGGHQCYFPRCLCPAAHCCWLSQASAQLHAKSHTPDSSTLTTIQQPQPRNVAAVPNMRTARWRRGEYLLAPFLSLCRRGGVGPGAHTLRHHSHPLSCASLPHWWHRARAGT